MSFLDNLIVISPLELITQLNGICERRLIILKPIQLVSRPIYINLNQQFDHK